jgi:hypothetical protein
MPTFQIAVTRIGYAIRNIEVEAANRQEAEKLALAAAGNHEFREHNAEYILPSQGAQTVFVPTTPKEGSYAKTHRSKPRR